MTDRFGFDDDLVGGSGDDRVDELLDALTDLGTDERRLSQATSTRIAHDAARVAARSGVRSGSPTLTPTSVPTHADRNRAEPAPEPTPIVGIRTRPTDGHRRWYPVAAVAAAAAVLAAAGYGLAAGGGQPTVVGSAGDGLEAEPLVTTTTEPGGTTDPSDAGQPLVVEAGPEPTDRTAASSSTTRTTADDADTSSSATGAPPSSADDSRTDAAPEAATDADAVDFDVGDAGAVAVSIDGTTRDIAVVDVTAAPGWSHQVDETGDVGVAVTFSDGNETAAFRAEFLVVPAADDEDAGGDREAFRLILEPNASHRSGATGTRTFEYQSAGSVTIDYGFDGLSGVEVIAQPGWSPLVSTPAPDRLDIRLVGPDNVRATRYRLRIGQVTVTIQAGN